VQEGRTRIDPSFFRAQRSSGVSSVTIVAGSIIGALSERRKRKLAASFSASRYANVSSCRARDEGAKFVGEAEDWRDEEAIAAEDVAAKPIVVICSPPTSRRAGRCL
jgi:hypothetical protein